MSLQELPMVFVLMGLVFYVVLGGADFGAAMWQFAVGRQVIQRRDKFAMCEITRSTEDHDAAGLWNGPRGQPFA